MSVDIDNVKKIAKLSKISLSENEIEKFFYLEAYKKTVVRCSFFKASELFIDLSTCDSAAEWMTPLKLYF